MRVANSIPLGRFTLLPVDTVNCVATLKAQSASDVLAYGTVPVAANLVDGNIVDGNGNRLARRAAEIELQWENVVFSGEPSVLAERIQATVHIHVPLNMAEEVDCAVRVAMDSGAINQNLGRKSSVFAGVDARFVADGTAASLANELAACVMLVGAYVDTVASATPTVDIEGGLVTTDGDGAGRNNASNSQTTEEAEAADADPLTTTIIIVICVLGSLFVFLICCCCYLVRTKKDNGDNTVGSAARFFFFRQKFTLEDAIRSHACSLEASRRVTNGIPLGSFTLLLPVDIKNCVATLKVGRGGHEKGDLPPQGIIAHAWKGKTAGISDRLQPVRTVRVGFATDHDNQPQQTPNNMYSTIPTGGAPLNGLKGVLPMQVKGLARCAFFDRTLHSRVPLSFTPLLRLKLLHACDQ
jgi:hypothetical protein